jgi:hypothetical protein
MGRSPDDVRTLTDIDVQLGERVLVLIANRDVQANER